MSQAIHQVIQRWFSSPLAQSFSGYRVFPQHPGKLHPFPESVVPELREGLKALGIEHLYEHQWRCFQVLSEKKHVVIATPTASGKSLCYNLSVFNALLQDPSTRALYLFPTKALARDQVEAARSLAAALGGEFGVAVYDGDTPPDQRRVARQRARVLATNPDMLHAGILPHHPSWSEFFSGLKYIVIDELHTYRGVFGSHVANVMKRLARISAHYDARPQLVATSATIANPEELFFNLLGEPATLIQKSGAPGGERHFMIYNPPLIDPALGLRESYLKAACSITRDLASAGINTLVFCRSRLTVEVLVRQLRDLLADEENGLPIKEEGVRGYRGGYLPEKRREIEQAMRIGQSQVVVSTSALELGIDIGSLGAVVMVGWPGSRAGTWQRAGRAGRRLESSLAVLIASSEPVDQFVAKEPGYFFDELPEQARINPDNASILIPHLKCAAFELPFSESESYGAHQPEETVEILACLAEAEILHRGPSGFYYTGQSFPGSEVHLRGHLDENFLVVEKPKNTVIAEVDYHDAPQVLHDKAIYQLEGQQFEVQRLDHDNRKAYVSAVDVDYFTDALTRTGVRILECLENDTAAFYGEVHVVHQVVGFKKIKLHTNENLGYGDVLQPEREMHTTAFWLLAPAAILENLQASSAELVEATLGLAFALHTVGALLLMSDPRDLGRAIGDARSGWFAISGRKSRGHYTRPDGALGYASLTVPTIFLFDRYPGGTGLAERLFDERLYLLRSTRDLLSHCECRTGCPACIGPFGGIQTKRLAQELAVLFLESCGCCSEGRAMVV